MKKSTIMQLKFGAAPLVLGLALVSAPAMAQDAEDGASEGEAIVVTGSRIARPDLDQASPVVVIGAEEIQLQATNNIENILNSNPQFVPSTTSASNNPGGGVATVDLRNLGTTRTLVLVDGRRYLSYDVNQIVDLNTIPAALIERVDVVTGGRSAVYGSDAIAGVVNFTTKRDFEGVELNSSYEISDEADGARFGTDLTIGGNFADGRGNVVAHVGYYKRKSVFAGQRAFTTNSLSDLGNGTLAPGGSSGIPELRARIAGLPGALGLTGTDVRFDTNGNAIQYSSPANLYNFGPVNYLQVPQERYIGYMRGTYEINEHFRPYVEAQFVNNKVPQQLAPTPIGNTTPGVGSRLEIQTNSPFLGAATRAALNTLDTDGNGYVSVPNFGRRLLEAGPRRVLDDRNAYRIVAGMEGEIGGNWSYDGYYMYARTRNSQQQQGNVAISRFLAGVKTAFQSGDTISATPIAGVAGGGTLVCADASARAAGCVPINIFGQNNISVDAVSYMQVGTINLEEAETQVASFAITNSELFDLGAGPVGLALGAEWRSESGSFTPDEFLSAGDVAGFNPGDPTSGGYSVTEFFGEVNIPIISDGFVHKFELNGAARYSNYSNEVKGAFTWAAGAVLEPIQGFTLRGQFQRAIRGPSINELFLGNTVSFDGAVDPCQTAAATSEPLRSRCISTGVPAALVGTVYGSGGTSFPATQGGNSLLREEASDTYTIGVVLQPAMLQGFSATVDYYNIKIDDYIATVGAQNIVDLCLNRGITSYCSQLARDSSGEFQSFTDLNQNAASLKTKGVDASLAYGTSIGNFLGEESRIDFRFNGSRLISYKYTPVVGVDLVNSCAGRFGRSCGEPTPKWRHSFRTTLSTGNFKLSGLWRYIGKVRDDDPVTVYASETLKAESYFDLAMSYDVNDNLNFVVNVDNLLDNKEPTPAGSTQQGGNGQQSNTFPSTYDVLGRYFSIGARLRF